LEKMSEVRMLQKSDKKYASAIARIHRARIPGGLAVLPRFAFAALYRSLIKDRRNGIFVRLDEDVVSGFVFGTVDDSAMYRRAVIRSAFEVVLGLLIVGLRPGRLLYFIRTALSARQVLARGSGETTNAHLVAIAVQPGVEKRGVGRELVTSLESWFSSRSVRSYKVMTNNSNHVAREFYRSCGFTEVGRQRHFPEEQVLFLKYLEVGL
jgi:ribosomal protein S18 acetylase RimI-like enzyme